MTSTGIADLFGLIGSGIFILFTVLQKYKGIVLEPVS